MSKPNPDDNAFSANESASRDEIFERFESAWFEGRPPSIDEYLPQDERRAEVLVELVHVDLECRIKAGQPARVEDYFGRYPELVADDKTAVELILTEYEFRRRSEPDLAADSYLTRFPQYVDLLVSKLSSKRFSGSKPAGRKGEKAGSTRPEYPAADSNLLFGILALQLDFINRDQMIAAMQEWATNKGKSLGEILLGQGALREAERLLLSALVRKHLEKHADDPQKSLASLSSIGSVRDEIRQIGDRDLEASLMHVSAARPDEDTEPPPVPSDIAPRPGPRRFRVLRPHAKGGLGEVFVAYDEEVRREVALKEIQRRHADHPESRARFLQEAEITGALEHPGIVPVYGLGTYGDGRPFYAMRFIRGDSLSQAVQAFRRPESRNRGGAERLIELRRLLGRLVDVCNAVEYAHSRGVLHRDLTPGNIMLGKYGETLIVDWGLAKPLGRKEGGTAGEESAIRPGLGSDAARTQAGSAVGTPAYMSPEQAAGRHDQLGPATDVYGLGATLYYILTGRPPQTGADVVATLDRIREGDFPRPRQIEPSIPHALEAICLKAMALRPEDRYQSPGELANDVERWLADEPVTAYPEKLHERMSRWARRHRTWVRASAAALVMVTLVSVAAVYLIAQAKQRETSARREAEKQRQRAVLEGKQANRARQWAEEEKREAEANLYFNLISQAHQQWQANNLVLADQLLEQCPPERRNWEWRFLKRLSNLEPLTLLPEERALDAGLAFAPDGRRLAVVHKKVQVWDTTTGDELLSFDAHGGSVSCVAFGPEGKRLATGGADNTIKIWDAQTGEQLLSIAAGGDSSFGPSVIAFSPDGNRVAATGIFRDVVVWDAATGQPLLTLDRSVEYLAFSPDGKLISVPAGPSVESEYAIETWDISSAELRHTLTGHQATVSSLAFSPNGESIVSGSEDQSVKVWDLATQRAIQTCHGHTDAVVTVAFAPDGKQIVSAGNDHTVRIWDAATGQQMISLPTHGRSTVRCVAFSPDLSKAATVALLSYGVKVWDLTKSLGARTLPDSRSSNCIAFNVDGTRIAVGDFGFVEVWDAVSGERLANHATSQTNDVAFSPDGQWIASAHDDKTVTLLSAATGKQLRQFNGHLDEVNAVAFSPSGKQIASASTDGTVRVWDVETGRELLKLRGSSVGVHCVAYSPDGKSIAAGGAGVNLEFLREDLYETSGFIQVWDAATGREVHSIEAHQGNTYGIAFSPDGKRIATAGQDHTVKLWDTETGEQLTTLDGHTNVVRGIDFSHDGQRIVTASWDNTVKLWDTDSGREVLTLRGHTSHVVDVAFSPDGKRIASAGDDAVRIWDAVWTPLSNTISGHTLTVGGVAFSPDGSSVASASNDNSTVLWDRATGQERWSVSAHARLRHRLMLGEHGDWLAYSSCQGVLRRREANRLEWDSVLTVTDAITGAVLLEARGGVNDPPIFSPNRDLIALATDPETVTIWERSAASTVATIRVPRYAASSILVFNGDSTLVASAGDDHVARIWDVRTGNEVSALEGHRARIHCLAFDPQGTRLASASEDGVVTLWDFSTGKEVFTAEAIRTDMDEHLAFSPAGDRFALVSDRGCTVWDTATGNEILAVGHRKPLPDCVAIGPHWEHIASVCDAVINLWDAATGTQMMALKGPDTVDGHVAFHPAGGRIVGLWHEEIGVWDVVSGDQLLKLPGQGSGAWRVAFSPDGQRMATIGWDDVIRVRDIATGEQLLEIPGVSGTVLNLAFRSDGEQLAADFGSGAIRVWDAATGERALYRPGNSGDVHRVAFSVDGRFVATTSDDRTVRIWDANSGAEIRTLRGHGKWTWGVAFSPDGTRIASGSSDQTVKLWDRETGAELFTLRGHEARVTDVAFTPDGRRLASAGWDQTVRLWDIASGRELATLRGHSGRVYGVACSTDGSRIASASRDRTVRIWHAESGQEMAVLHGHSSQVLSVSFSPDGKWIASGSRDKTIKIWNALTGQEILSIRAHDYSVMDVAFSADGNWLASASSDHRVKIWDTRMLNH